MSQYLLSFVGLDTSAGSLPAVIQVNDGGALAGDTVVSATVVAPPTSGAFVIGQSVTAIFDQFPVRVVPSASNVTVNGVAGLATPALVITQSGGQSLASATIVALMQSAT